MKASVIIKRGGYGFSYTWTLRLEGKSKTREFYLGQDVKFCHRVLGVDPSYIIQQIGTREVDNGTRGNKLLARFILDHLNEYHLLTTKKIMNLQPWELCAE